MKETKDTTSMSWGDFTLRGAGKAAQTLGYSSPSIVAILAVTLLKPMNEWLIFASIVLALLISAGLTALSITRQRPDLEP